MKGLPKSGVGGCYRYHKKGSAWNKDNYIGEAKDILARYYQHLNNPNPNKGSIDWAIKEYGIDAFEFEWFLFLDSTKVQRLTLEYELIKIFDSYNNGYNKNRSSAKAYKSEIKAYIGHEISWEVFDLIRTFISDNYFRGSKVLINSNIDNSIIISLEKMLKCKVTVVEQEFIWNEKKWVVDSEKNKKDMENMLMGNEFDIIISNPPYGKVGCEITKNIIDNVNFKKFINLLPADDYIKRGKNMNLWQYVKDPKEMIPITAWQVGMNAAVTTHIAEIRKNQNLSIQADEFEIENFLDPSLNKFFYENKDRKHYAIDAVRYSGPQISNIEKPWYNKKDFIIGYRDMHNCKVKDCKVTRDWNVEKSIDFDELLALKKCGPNRIQIVNIHFNTELENENFVKFMYSQEGHEFYAKMWASMNIDQGIRSLGFIKVDWTKEWTVEEILKDYGYTDKEIKEVMDDVHNYRNRRK